MTISRKEVPLWDYVEVTLEAEVAGNPFQDVSGILSGYPSCGTPAEMEKINSLLRETPDN